MCRGEIFTVLSLDKIPKRSILILQIPDFPYSAVWDWSNEGSMQKTTSIRQDVSIERRLVTYRDTDRHRIIASTALAWRRAGKIAHNYVTCVCVAVPAADNDASSLLLLRRRRNNDSVSH